jgi:serine/threonine protein kinase/WD40 repeat protein
MADHSLLLGQLVEDFTARVRAGQLPDLEDYARRYPDLAERIRALFPTLLLLEGMAGGKAADPARAPGVGAAVLTPGQTFNHYRIERELGRGGMGVVYEAVHVPLGKRVALKVLPVFAAQGPSQLERFLREAKTAAALHHTNIVPVFDIGQAGGLPYYAMQFIPGCGLDQVLRQIQADQPEVTPSAALPAPTGPYTAGASDEPHGVAPPGTGPVPKLVAVARAHSLDFFRQVAELGIQAAGGLAFAHQRGVIHRDIKPSNLLLDEQGVLWITDFGLARRADDPALTHSGVLVGTPRYMSPEQAEAARRPIDHRTDIYSLGATLYELVTYRPAFSGQTPAEVVVQILEREPVAPRQLNAAVPRDLETIILKAMAKRPDDRYQTAAEMAADLQRWQRLEPIQARRIGPVGRSVRWCRRNPRLAAVSMVYVAVILVTSCLYVWKIRTERTEAECQRDQAVTAREQARTQRTEAEYQRDQAVAAREQALDHLCRSYYEQARGLVAADHLGHRWQALDRIKETEALLRRNRSAAPAADDPQRAPPLPSRYELRNLAVTALLTPDMRIHHQWTGLPLAVSSNKRWAQLVQGESEGQESLLLVDLLTGRETRIDPSAVQPDLQIKFSGRALSGDGQWWALHDEEKGLYLCCLSENNPQVQLLPAPPVGRPVGDANSLQRSSLIFTPDGSEVLELRPVDQDQRLLIAWDLRTKAPPRILVRAAGVAGKAFCLSADARWLALPTGREITLWSLAKPGEPIRLPLDASADDIQVLEMDLAPNGQLLAAVVKEKDQYQLRLWDVATHRGLGSLPADEDQYLACLQFSPDSRRLVVLESPKTLRFFQVLPLREELRQTVPEGINMVRWHPDGRSVVFYNLKSGGFIQAEPTWEPARTRMPIGGKQPTALAFSPDGRWAAMCFPDAATLHLVKRASGETRRLEVPLYSSQLTFRADSTQLGILGLEAWVVLEIPSGKELARVKARECRPGSLSGAFDAAGEFLAVAWDQNNEGTLWNVTTKTLLWRLPKEITSAKLSAGGRFLVAWPGKDEPLFQAKEISVWDLAAHQKVGTFPAGRIEFFWPGLVTGPGNGLGLSPQSRWLLTPVAAGVTGPDKLAILWRFPSLEQELIIPTKGGTYGQSVFSADERLLAIADTDGLVHLWDLEHRIELFQCRLYAGPFVQLQFTPDGTALVTNDWETPELQVIHLPTLRRQLAEIGLEW